ncbi:hypothetical protein EN751_00050 [Mesorhizobium sp. M4A.F.Ca.ET.029.04.2.1]|nr:hypothetical protein EN779_04585 [Mesorhizobium sp. M4B.F.Ca.ET.088.02.2.1]RVD74302.1 hypothetical protein EN751_00050 [Mesorhizobium sp. M4A.F.Ca.ET.029.04.2.1]RWF28761.1 MAG: hypothetical protein EOS45_21045 [Mesorhizobium sp.]RWL02847.1 MAG: hypothetical protein EOR55_20865 [Mesorhizobium sp.]
MSSLLLVPTLLRQLSPAKKLAVITADSIHCTGDLLGIEDPADRARVVIGGMERGVYTRNALARPYVRTDIDQIEHEIEDCVAQLRAEHPEIEALLFECTGFACVTNAMRRKTGFPIYDVTDLCRMTLGTIVIPNQY